MSICDTCENSYNCKEQEFVRRMQFEQHLLSCSGFKKKEDRTDEYVKFKMALKQAFAKEEDSWIVTEKGCVITCPKCGHRLELCYPDGTEVTYLPHCPWCGKKLEAKK